MSRKALHTNDSVKRYARTDQHLTACGDADIIEVERIEFLGCLGWDFYQELLANEPDYSSAATWAPGSYAEGDVVKYRGYYKIATTATTQEPNGAEWENAPTFEEPLFETMWCEYLGRYLALCVVRNDLAGHMVKVSDKGIVRQVSENTIPATRAEVELLSKDIDRKISGAFKLLDTYLMDNKTALKGDGVTVAFRNYAGIKNTCGTTPCANRKRNRNGYNSY